MTRFLPVSLVVSLVAALSPLTGQNVFHLPGAAGATSITAWTNTLVPISSLPVAAVPLGVYANPAATKYVAVSPTSNGGTITIFDSPLGTGAIRTLTIDQTPTGAVLTADGRRLLIAAGNLRIVDIGTTPESLLANVPLNTVTDVAASPDSRYAYLLSSQGVSLFDIASNTIVTSKTLGGTSAITVGPGGLVYVSATNQIAELDPRTLETRGTISINARPGKLSITPDGRYGVAVNQTTATGTSILCFDLANRVLSAATLVTVAGVSVPLTSVVVPSNLRAMAFSNDNGKIYEFALPGLSFSEASYSPSTGTRSLALSSEVPARSLYYSSETTLARYDLLTGALPNSTGVASGRAVTAGPASTAAPAQMIKFGDNQTAQTAAAFGPLAVQVLDNSERPVTGAVVTFSSSASGLTLVTNSSTTGSTGTAVAYVNTMPSVIGTYAVTATTSSGVTQTFTLTVGTSTGGGGGGGGGTGQTTITKISGDGWLYYQGYGNLPTLVAEVRNAAGNLMPFVPVTWTVNGDGTIFTSGTTNELGQATATFSSFNFFGFGINGYSQSTVTATTESGQTTTFTVTSIPVAFNGSTVNPPIVNLIAPTGDRVFTLKAGSTTPAAVQLQVLTGGGGGSAPFNPIPGVGVSASTNLEPSAGPTASCQGNTPLSDASGFVNCNLVAGGTVGSANLKVLVGGAFAVDFALTVTPGDPSTPIIVQGNNQSGNTGTTLPLALVARTVDAYGNTLIGTPVTWEVVTPGSLTLQNVSTASDSSGRVSALARLGNNPGAFSVILRVGSQSVTFTVNVISPVGSVNIVSGSNQPAALINTAFAQPLVVQVVNTQNVALPGITVNWSVTAGSASLSSASSVTDASGRASITVTAGAAAGAITVASSVASGQSATFALTSVGVGSLIRVSGQDNPVVLVNSPFPQALVVQVNDSLNRPIPNVQVNWTVSSGSATVSAPSSVTNASGQASINAAAGPVAGAIGITASVAGGQSTTFSLASVTVGSLTRVSGQDNPVTVINTAFPQPLVVQASDTLGRPTPGVSVLWSVTSGSASVSAPSSVANASGQASINVTAGPNPGPITVAATVGGFSVSFNLTSRLPGPVLNTNSFTNPATNEVGVVPGGLVLITGPGLAPNLRGTMNGSILGGKLPLEINGVNVGFGPDNNLSYAPIYAVSNVNGVESVLVQAPFEVSGQTVNVRVSVSGSVSTVQNVPVRAYGPGLLEEVESGVRRAVALRSDGQRVSTVFPARPGERIRLYVIGLGQTTPAAMTNVVGVPNQDVQVRVTVGLDNQGVTPVSARMAGNLVGVYEVVFDVPTATPNGDRPLGLFIEATPGVPLFANGSVLFVQR